MKKITSKHGHITLCSIERALGWRFIDLAEMAVEECCKATPEIRHRFRIKWIEKAYRVVLVHDGLGDTNYLWDWNVK